MEHLQKTILVAWDFSNVAEYAMQHAIRFAETIGSTMVTILNIVDSKDDIENATRQLNIVAEDAQKKYNFKPEVLAVEGDIFTTIKNVANQLNSPFVFMGTHGIKGLQKITGSWALKVIEGSNCPFIVVQRPPQDEHFGDIVCPVEYKKEDKQKVGWAVYLNKFFKSKIYLYVQKSNDANLKRQIYSNLVHMKSVLDQHKIEYTEVEGAGKDDFAEEVIEYAHAINANAILVSTYKELDWADYMFGANEQKIIGNKYGISAITVLPNPGRLKGFN